MRLFVAIALPDFVRRSLLELSRNQAFAGIPPNAFVRAENLHLTLKFIGEVVDPDVSRVCEVLKHIPQTGLIRLMLDHVVCLPERGPVRIIGIRANGDLDRLQSLYDSIEGLSEQLGVRKEGRRFFPHITIARLRRTLSPAVRPSLERIMLRRSPNEGFEVREIVLMQSIIERQGARYVPVARFPIDSQA
jgi:2'-5' RNA ligase